MSYTIIPAHRDGILATENVANRLQKHCRIVNVKWKSVPDKSLYEMFKTMPLIPSFPFYNNTVPHQCKGCVGKACGNVACPMRPVVTCGPNTGIVGHVVATA